MKLYIFEVSQTLQFWPMCGQTIEIELLSVQYGPECQPQATETKFFHLILQRAKRGNMMTNKLSFNEGILKREFRARTEIQSLELKSEAGFGPVPRECKCGRNFGSCPVGLSCAFCLDLCAFPAIFAFAEFSLKVDAAGPIIIARGGGLREIASTRPVGLFETSTGK